MNPVPLNPSLPDPEALFAAERELVPEPAALRERVMERARMAVPQDEGLRQLERSTRLRRLRTGELAVAAVLLSAASAAAFYAGYHSGGDRGAAADSARLLPRIVATLPAVPSVAPPMPKAAVPPGPTQRSKLVTPAKVATDTEAFAQELRVLQPARRAVARQEYASALTAIAEHQRQYPSGKLTEEREALRVRALLGLGRNAEAERAGAAFRTRFPRSALLSRVDEMLGTHR